MSKKYLSISITRGYTYDVTGLDPVSLENIMESIRDNDPLNEHGEPLEEVAKVVHYEGYVDVFEER